MSHDDAVTMPAFTPSVTEALAILLPLAFAEDEGPGDVTCAATLDPGHRSQGALVCKEDGILAGAPVVEAVFRQRFPDGHAPRVEWYAADGDTIRAGTVLARFEGDTHALLVCERIILNFLQRLSGIATVARAYAEAAAPARVLDTRKTLPGWRALDKYAVAVGGGENHRMGLYDRVLIKDNHADACGSVRAAVERASAYRGAHGLLIEAEVRTLEEVASLLDAPVDILLLDNMDDAALRAAVALVRSHPRPERPLRLEASGNLDLARVARLRDAGLDYFSVGALTHSVKALDLSLKIGSFIPGHPHA
ncbi:MAG TPA: carboxylating nicotinate-nucleotide diphosphorylase [Fibrobacteria bacterium]|nr:carboxylating nicotinate-nucleotide diphosphorylase [Fibrobacteria bacterium]